MLLERSEEEAKAVAMAIAAKMIEEQVKSTHICFVKSFMIMEEAFFFSFNLLNSFIMQQLDIDVINSSFFTIQI